MNTAEAEELLKRYLLKGVGARIAYADLSYALAEEIREHAEQINGASFGELFGSLQVMLSDRQTLEATKLFDPEKGRERNFSETEAPNTAGSSIPEEAVPRRRPDS